MKNEKVKHYGNVADLVEDGLISEDILGYNRRRMSIDEFASLTKELSSKVDSLYLTTHQGQIYFPQARLWLKKPAYQSVASSKNHFRKALHVDNELNKDIALGETALGRYNEEGDWYINGSQEEIAAKKEKYSEGIQKDLLSGFGNLIISKDFCLMMDAKVFSYDMVQDSS